MSDFSLQLVDMQTEALQELLEGIEKLLVEGDTDAALQACRFVLNLIAILKVPADV